MAARSSSVGLLWTRQPNIPTRLAKTPLTQGLVEAFLPIGGNVYPVTQAGLGPPLTNNNTPGWAYVPRFGSAIDYGISGGAKNSVRNSTPAPFSASFNSLKECSILVLSTNATPPLTATTFWAGYGLSSSANEIFALGVDSTGNKLQFFVRDHANVSQNTSGATTIPTGDLVAIGTRSEAGNFHRLYLNGTQDLNTTATAIGTSSFNRATLGGLTRNSFANAAGGKIPLVAVWRRSLTPAEVASLSANPWQVFEYRRRTRVGLGGGPIAGAASEAVSLAFSGSATAARVASDSENIALGFTGAGAGIFAKSITAENVALGYSASATGTFGKSIAADNVTLGYTASAAGAFPKSAPTQNVALGFSAAGILAQTGAITAGVSLAWTASATLIKGAADTEAVSLGFAATVQALRAAAASAAVALGFSATGQRVTAASVSASVALGFAGAASRSAAASVAETFAAGFAASAQLVARTSASFAVTLGFSAIAVIAGGEVLAGEGVPAFRVPARLRSFQLPPRIRTFKTLH